MVTTMAVTTSALAAICAESIGSASQPIADARPHSSGAWGRHEVDPPTPPAFAWILSHGRKGPSRS